MFEYFLVQRFEQTMQHKLREILLASLVAETYQRIYTSPTYVYEMGSVG